MRDALDDQVIGSAASGIGALARPASTRSAGRKGGSWPAERTFGVQDHFRSLGRALRAQGFSPQRPIARARERDGELGEAWLWRDWARLTRWASAAFTTLADLGLILSSRSASPARS